MASQMQRIAGRTAAAAEGEAIWELLYFGARTPHGAAVSNAAPASTALVHEA